MTACVADTIFQPVVGFFPGFSVVIVSFDGQK